MSLGFENVVFLDIETTGLLPASARITCIGLLNDSGVKVFGFKNEKKTLDSFFEWLSSNENVTFVTYNGTHFDFEFIKTRSKFLEINESLVKKLDGVKHVDLLPIISKKYGEIVGETSTGRISQASALKWFNIYTQAVGSSTNALLVAKTSSDWSEVFLHNVIDLFSTKKLFEKCLNFKWV